MKNAAGTLDPPLPEAGMVAMEQREFKLLRALIQRETGIWLRDGKQVMLAARLSRRLRAHGMADFAEYCAYVESVKDGGKELGELINCVTTNKTSFFREKHHFDFLSQTLVPELRHATAHGHGRQVRVWSAACSTGEEPYSIVMTLLEATQAGGWDVSVVASDIDTGVLQKAQRGLYPAESLDDVPPVLHSRYFLRGKGEMAGMVKVKTEVANRVEFKRINLMDNMWPVEGPFDAIFFRNALIYFEKDTQELFLRKMLRLLSPRGYLILGHSEHVPWLHDAVVPLNRNIHQLREHGGAGAPRVTGPRRQRIYIGEMAASAEPLTIETLLGSCVAVCLYDPGARAGGMNHILLPGGAADAEAPHLGFHAMEMLIRAVTEQGANPRRLVAKAFGAANVMNVLRPPTVGDKNAEFVRAFLAQRKIPLVAQRLGGSSAVKVLFHTDTGTARVQSVDGSRLGGPAVEGAAAGRLPAAAAYASPESADEDCADRCIAAVALY